MFLKKQTLSVLIPKCSLLMNFSKLLIVAFSFLTSILSAQFHEIGVFLGGSNYIGDVGNTRYINPNNLAYGFLYKWNLNTRYTFRASVNTTNLKGTDLRTNDLNRFRRQYQFENNIKELVVGIEVNFVDFDLLSVRRQFSPYIFVGLGYFQYELFYFSEDNSTIPQVISYGNRGDIILPFTVGVKSNITKKMTLGFEIGARYTLTDNIDGSNPINEFSDIEELKFGNLGNNDWYIFTGLTISFTFGKLPCYCK